MARRRRRAAVPRVVLVALLGVVGSATVARARPLVTAAARAQVPNATAGTRVEITIAADSARRWLVTERFVGVAAGDSAATGGFQFLSRPCTAVEDLVITNGRQSASLVAGTNGPWRTLTDTSAVSRNARVTGEFELHYRVAREADAVDVPLVVPTRSLARDPEARLGNVAVVVRLSEATGEVTFPRLSRTGDDDAWRGSFVAVPSFVHVRLTEDAGTCAHAVSRGDDGGLTWRFWLLVAILTIWVPTYQWWARRQTDGDA